MEVMEARLCVEPALAALAARRATPGDVARMRTLAARTRASGDPDSTELWDGALHRLIARAAGNRPLLTALSMLDEIRATEGWRDIRARARSAETLRTSDRQHHAIIDAIEAGSPAAAERAMRAHLETLAENLARILRGAAGAGATPSGGTHRGETHRGGDAPAGSGGAT
jgi:DNA-binding FadR family transcriptional regulator